MGYAPPLLPGQEQAKWYDWRVLLWLFVILVICGTVSFGFALMCVEIVYPGVL